MVSVAPETRARLFPHIVAESALFRDVLIQAERFATSRISILLVGETGTGKELLAEYIHALSGRSGELVDLNCGGFPRDMMESLLFGHRRGAFTGAVEDRAGLVAQADGGTLFLDELASLPLDGQAKLLRLLETGELRRLGEATKRRIDFRLIAAVQEDFLEQVQAGRFRRDLYHRVEGVRLELPPLRARPEDIAPLATRFAGDCGCELELPALALLREYGWPGNVRELRNVVERAAVLSSDAFLSAELIAQALGQGMVCAPIATTPLEPRAAMVDVCARNGWDVIRIAAELEISRATVYRRLKSSGIRLRSFSKSHGVAPRLRPAENSQR